MHPPEVVIHKVECHGCGVVLGFFEKAFVRRVNRRIDIRIVRFWRSRYDVEMCFVSGAHAAAGIAARVTVIILKSTATRRS